MWGPFAENVVHYFMTIVVFCWVLGGDIYTALCSNTSVFTIVGLAYARTILILCRQHRIKNSVMASKPEYCQYHKHQGVGSTEGEREWLDDLIAWNPELPEALDPSERGVGHWMQRTEELWLNLCGDLVKAAEVIEHPENWFDGMAVTVIHIINLVTAERFMQEWALGGESTAGLHINDLAKDGPPSYKALVNHLDGIDVPVSERPWDYGMFKMPTEDTYLKAAEFQRGIKKAHAELCEKLRAAQDNEAAQNSKTAQNAPHAAPEVSHAVQETSRVSLDQPQAAQGTSRVA